jgi:hypothetical protein
MEGVVFIASEGTSDTDAAISFDSICEQTPLFTFFPIGCEFMAIRCCLSDSVVVSCGCFIDLEGDDVSTMLPLAPSPLLHSSTLTRELELSIESSVPFLLLPEDPYSEPGGVEIACCCLWPGS